MDIDQGPNQAKVAPFPSAGSGAAYDPGTSTWVPLPRVPAIPWDGASAAWTGRQLLVWGSTSAGRNFGEALSPGKAAGASGYVEGTAQYCTGPIGSKPPPGSVMAVTASHGGRIAAIQFVEAPFDFRFQLAPGSYAISASSDVDPTVTVRAGTKEKVRLNSACG